MARWIASPVAWLPSLGDVAFLMPVIFLFGRLDGVRSLLGDGDTGWHIRAGEWILANGRVPREDLFSFTMPGHPWFAWEWLAEVAMGWLHRRGGMAAVTAAAVFILCLTFALLYRLLAACSGNVLVAIGLTGVAVAGSSIHWLARPHLATLLGTVAFLAVLESQRRWLMWILPPLAALWANIHAGFLIGIFLMAAYSLCERRLDLRLATVAALAATLANPYSWHLHGHILRYLAADSWQFAHINEFFSPDFHSPLAIFFEFMLALGIASACRHLLRGRYHYVLLVAGTSHMALVSARHVPIFLIVAAPAVAVAMREWEQQWQSREGAQRLSRAMRAALGSFTRLAADISAIEGQPRAPVWSALSMAALAIALASPAAAGKLRAGFDPAVFPVRAVETLRGTGAHIYTSDQWGDYLIYRLYPEIRVFVDGRSDFYGSDLEQICLDVWNVRYDWQKMLGRYRVDTVLLPAEAPLAGALKESGRWRVAYDDGRALIFRLEAEPVSGATWAVGHAPEYSVTR